MIFYLFGLKLQKKFLSVAEFWLCAKNVNFRTEHLTIHGTRQDNVQLVTCNLEILRIKYRAKIKLKVLFLKCY